MNGDGALPEEIRDVQLCERFGWTLEELDTQDMARILPGIAGEYVRHTLMRVQAAIDRFELPNQEDFELYAHVEKLTRDGR